jgi:hypothetical protein
VGPTGGSGLACCDPDYSLLSERPTHLACNRLDWFLLNPGSRRHRRFDHISQLGEAIQTPTQNLAIRRKRQCVVLSKCNGDGMAHKKWDWLETVLCVLSRAQADESRVRTAIRRQKSQTYRPPLPNPHARRLPRFSVVITADYHMNSQPKAAAPTPNQLTRVQLGHAHVPHFDR